MALNLVPVHCRGCGRRGGYVFGVPQQTFYCTQLCSILPDLGREQERDDLIEDLARTGWKSVKLASVFGISRQRASQVADARLV